MSITSIRTVLLASVMVFSVFGCEDPRQMVTTGELPLGYWQASIALPGGDIETGIELNRDGDVYTASLINGQERVRIDQVSYIDDVLRLTFPAFNNEIRATFADGLLTGELTLVKRFGATQVMPFRATPGSETGQESNETSRHDLSGRWAVKFHEPDGSDSASIGEFAQRGSRLFGTFLNPNGDHRFLAGHVRGDEFHLSTFDGSHAFVFSGQVGETGLIENAGFWSGTNWHQTWSAERSDNVELPDAFSRTFLKPGYERFEFAFPSEEGVMTSLDDEKYRDKVVLVTIAGTWCPNCNDEARFLAPFYKEYRDQGLEIVALLFEHFEDHELAAEQVRAFRQKFDIQYDTLIAGISDKTEAANTLPQLSAVLAFPTTIFIDRDNRVREIHTGFTGPGTGEHYVRLQERFTELTSGLLAEPPDLIESLMNVDAPGDEPATNNK
jgi:thiol-disulfide isomerase/thioredoxin